MTRLARTILLVSLSIVQIACAQNARKLHGTQTILDSGETRFVPDAPLVATQPTPPTTTQPIPPPVDFPPTATVCTYVVSAPNLGPASPLPGDTICFHGGDYAAAPQGQLEESTLAAAIGGEAGKPITYRNVAGEVPIIHGKYPLTYAFKVGKIPSDRDKSTGVSYVVIDGLRMTEAPRNGLVIEKSSNIIIRNCWIYGNNYSDPQQGYFGGIEITSGGGQAHDFLIERCRVFDDGIGITVGPDQAGVTAPPGINGVVVRDNFIFGNSRTANFGNSSGLELWFCNHAVVGGNILYDNPDAGINGEGNNFCRYVNNICINNWQPGGNNEGIKTCVRGGGCNVVANNISVANGNCGFDAASGVGDLLVGNTLYGNGSWGALVEGRETMLFNNLVAGNSTAKTDNAYPEQDAAGWSLISDWQRYGTGPVKSTQNDTLVSLPPNTSISPITLSTYALPRSDPRQINPPEKLWGVSTAEEVRAKILAAYRPSAPLPGTSLTTVTSLANANIPKVQASLDAAISAATASSDFQMKQATDRWQALKAQLAAGACFDLSGLPDNQVIGAAK